jgi:hypothetical protein
MHAYSAVMQSDTKRSRGNRLKHAREAAGYKTAAAFARAVNAGLDDYTYRTYESGSRNMSYDYAEKFSIKLGVSVEWLLTGKLEHSRILSAPIRGNITDGGLITAAHSLTGGITMGVAGKHGVDDIDSVEDVCTSAFFALVVETNQFEPHTRRGSIIYYSRSTQDPETCIGSQCIIQIRGGQPVFGVLLRGSHAGLFDIQGHGHDVEIDTTHA